MDDNYDKDTIERDKLLLDLIMHRYDEEERCNEYFFKSYHKTYLNLIK